MKWFKQLSTVLFLLICNMFVFASEDLQEIVKRDRDLDMKIFSETLSCPGGDFSGAYLSPVINDWHKRNGTRTKVNLAGANLEGALIFSVDLERANLAEANLALADLQGCNLSLANCRKAIFEGANCQAVNFSGANLEYANLKNSHLQAAHLRRARLFYADFLGAHCIDAVGLNSTLGLLFAINLDKAIVSPSLFNGFLRKINV